MAYIVAEPCVKCKYTDCVEVCPVDCFYEDEFMLVIDPEECIDCGACVPECPVDAIFEIDDLPEKWESYIQINADKAKEMPVITEQKEALADYP
ncbi:MAG TPA: ferredoxin [Lentisphaeria bacterium]|jgi:ferredoxin|nr:ferredoxin [Lentisphaeria bacterium]